MTAPIKKRASSAFADHSRPLRKRGVQLLVEEPSSRGAREKCSWHPADAVDGPVEDQLEVEKVAVSDPPSPKASEQSASQP